MSGWIISLGAGREQLPLIRAIQAEGFHCLAFDMDENAPGKDIADHFAPVSNRDVDEIERLAKGWVWIHGVIAAASEVPDAMAILGERLGCPNVPVATGVLLKDKLRYKEILKAAGVPHTEAAEMGEELKREYPCVFKPRRDSSGSRGVYLVKVPDDALVAGIFSSDKYGSSLVERYQPGPQISSETLFWDGHAVTVAFADRHYAGFAKEVGVSMPSRFKGLEPAAHEIIVRAARALGIQRGTLKCDLVLTEKGPKIIECTCRLSGGPLQKLVLASKGFDYFRQALRIACGCDPDWSIVETVREKQASFDMLGNPTDYIDAQKYIEKELGACK